MGTTSKALFLASGIFKMNIIHKYFIHSLSYSKSRFIFEFALVSILLKLITGLLLGVIDTALVNINFLQLNEGEGLNHQDYDYFFLIIFLGFVAPFLETFVQWIPISIMKKITNNYLIIVLFTSIIFASLHISYSIFYAIIMLPLGIILSCSFYCKYKNSLWEAFLATFTIHSVHNFISIFLPYAFN